jgi:hypothetical protein
MNDLDFPDYCPCDVSKYLEIEYECVGPPKRKYRSTTIHGIVKIVKILFLSAPIREICLWTSKSTQKLIFQGNRAKHFVSIC